MNIEHPAETSERFYNERRAFRTFIAEKNERELELLMDDIKLRKHYLKTLTPLRIIRGE